MVGLFINTLPVRVRVRPQESLRELLARVQKEQSDLIEHQHLGLSEIQNLVGLGELFDTLIVLENYPLDRDAFRGTAVGARVSTLESRDITHYALCLAVLPGTRLHLRLAIPPGSFPREAAEGICTRFERLLEAVANDAETTGREARTTEPA